MAVIQTLMTTNPDVYTVDTVMFWLSGGRWEMLVSATQGGVSSGARGGGNGLGRMGLVALKADLEQAADSLPIYWRSTSKIYKLQWRWNEYISRRGAVGRVNDPEPDPGIDLAMLRMAGFLNGLADRAA